MGAATLPSIMQCDVQREESVIRREYVVGTNTKKIHERRRLTGEISTSASDLANSAISCVEEVFRILNEAPLNCQRHSRDAVPQKVTSSRVKPKNLEPLGI